MFSLQLRNWQKCDNNLKEMDGFETAAEEWATGQCDWSFSNFYIKGGIVSEKLFNLNNKYVSYSIVTYLVKMEYGWNLWLKEGNF